MSHTAVETLLQEQEEALSKAITRHRRIKELVRAQWRQQSTSKRPKPDHTPTAAASSDEDLLEAVRQHEEQRAQRETKATAQQPALPDTQHTGTQPGDLMACQQQDGVRQQQHPEATQHMAAGFVLPIAGLRAFHLCPAEHNAGSKCLLLRPHSSSEQVLCPCGRSQEVGVWMLVEFWLKGTQHFCIATTHTAVNHSHAQQLGAPSTVTKYLAHRLAMTTATATAMRVPNSTSSEVITTRNGYWSIKSEDVLSSLSRLTWDEIVLAHMKALDK